jgi:ADP-heptose:LPS heptosyltransferase
LTESFVGFQLKNLGDALMTLPGLALLKKNRPDSWVTMVVRPSIAELLENHPLVDEVIAHSFAPRKLDIRKTLKLAKRLREKNPVASFHFDGQQRGGILALLARIPLRAVGVGLLGVTGLKRPYLYNRKILLKPDNSPWESLALSHKRLVALTLGLDSPGDTPTPGLAIPLEAKAKAASLLSSWPGEGPLIGLTLKGRQPEKSWPLDFWAEVVKALKQKLTARFYVTGEASDGVLAASLVKLIGFDIGNFCGLTSLMELVALAAASDLFLTIDTGSAHLVSTTATPLVTIFTATNPVQWGALAQKRVQLAYNWALARFGLDSGPFIGCPVVRPAEVIKAALDLLAES